MKAVKIRDKRRKTDSKRKRGKSMKSLTSLSSSNVMKYLKNCTRLRFLLATN